MQYVTRHLLKKTPDEEQSHSNDSSKEDDESKLRGRNKKIYHINTLLFSHFPVSVTQDDDARITKHSRYNYKDPKMCTTSGTAAQ